MTTTLVSRQRSAGKGTIGESRLGTCDCHRHRRAKQTEQWLQESEEQLRTTIELATVGIAFVALDGRWLRANQRLCDIVGYSRNELLKLTFQDITHPDDLDGDVAAIRQMLAGEIQTYSREKRYIRKDQSLVWINLTTSLVRDASGEPKHFVSVVEDISERKRAEQATIAGEEKYRVLVESAEAAISTVTYDGRFLYLNQFAAQLMHSKPEDLTGKTIYDVLPREAAEQQLANIRRAIESGQGAVVESPSVILGQAHWFHTGIQPLRDESGAVSSALVIAVDITVQRQLEESLRAALAEEKKLSELRACFVSMVSHDFRTPLAIIRSSADLLRTYCDNMDEERKARHFDKIIAQIDRMITLLNDVLTISRADAGADPFNPILLDLDRFCQDLADEFRGVPDMKHTLVYTSPGEPIEVPIDEKLLQQAVVNLLANAFKYSPEGSDVYLDLSFDEDNAVIRVKDNGIGIPEPDQPRLFDPFHRAGNVGEIEGTGLGLAIVKRSVEAHGGTITFESQVGVGTTFIIRIPKMIR